MQAVMAHVRLHKCAGLSKPLLVANAIKPNSSVLANMFWVTLRHTKTVLLIAMLIEFYQIFTWEAMYGILVKI